MPLPRESPVLPPRVFGSCCWMVLLMVGIIPYIQAFQSASKDHLRMYQDRIACGKPSAAVLGFTGTISALLANVLDDGQTSDIFGNDHHFYSNSNQSQFDAIRRSAKRTSALDTDRSSTMPTSIESATSRSRTDRNVGGYDPSERLSPEREVNVGDPQIKVAEEKEFSVTSILRELAAIQQAGPRKYCILGTRHCSFLHQQIIELLAYALVLSGNHVYTSGAGGTHAATIRGALRAEKPALLTVVLPQSRRKQSEETQKLLELVEDVIEMPQNNEMSLDIASRICNSYLLSLTDQLISFAFHESNTVIEATREAKKMNKLVTVLFLD